MSYEVVVYLAGGMEYAEDGRSWRQKASKDLGRMGYAVWEPYSKEAEIMENGLEPLEIIPTLDKEKDFQKVNRIMRRVVEYDLDVLRTEVDVVFVKYDRSVMMGAGTHGEISVAAMLDIPVIAWVDKDLDMNEVPSWALGCFSTVYRSYDAAIQHFKI